MRHWLYLKPLMPDIPARVLRQHEGVYEAIRRRDVEGARAAMLDHLESTVRLIAQVVEQHAGAET